MPSEKLPGGRVVVGLRQMELEIERKRLELYDSCNQYGLSSFVVLEKSQELDMLLNEYQKKLSGK